MMLKRSQFLALVGGALMTPIVASCGKSAAPSGPVDVSPEGEGAGLALIARGEAWAPSATSAV